MISSAISTEALMKICKVFHCIVGDMKQRAKLNKSLKSIQERVSELHSYGEKIHYLADWMIAIDLDDGVKYNYEILKMFWQK